MESSTFKRVFIAEPLDVLQVELVLMLPVWFSARFPLAMKSNSSRKLVLLGHFP